MSVFQVRHGDVLLTKISEAPKGAKMVESKSRSKVTLAYGEVTGHAHVVTLNDTEGALKMLEQERGGTPSIIEIPSGGATLDHEEHGPVQLPEGLYQVVIQREYEPEVGQRMVAD